MLKNKLKIDGTPSHQGEGGGGVLRKYENEEELNEMCKSFIADCILKQEVPSKAGLYVHLDLSPVTFAEYKKKYPNTIRRVVKVIERAWVQRLASSPTGAIFYLKNAFKEDYKDRTETDVTTDGKPIQFGWQEKK